MEKVRPSVVESCPEGPVAKSSFAEIYGQWEKSHDEKAEIARRASASERVKSEGPTIGAVRRMDAQDELDLHEMLLDDALTATREFLDSSASRNLLKVRIITGKGIHSKGGEAVLRPAVIELCRKHPKVREVTVPKAAEGGSGALTVILKHRTGR